MTTAGSIADLGTPGAVLLGLLTAIQPCPLATLAGSVALAFSPDRTLAGNLLRGWTLVVGMIVSFTLLAFGVTHGLQGIASTSGVLPRAVAPFVAPLLILVGIYQIGLFRRGSSSRLASLVEARLRSRSPGPLVLLGAGMLLALALCPATGGLFLGVLVPCAMAQELPALAIAGFGIGYGLPLLAVTACLSLGVRGEVVRRHAAAIRCAGGWALIAWGAWLTWRLL